MSRDQRPRGNPAQGTGFISLCFTAQTQGSALVEACCSRYRWHEIWSSKSSLSNRLMCLKAYQTIKQGTALHWHRIYFKCFIFSCDIKPEIQCSSYKVFHQECPLARVWLVNAGPQLRRSCIVSWFSFFAGKPYVIFFFFCQSLLYGTPTDSPDWPHSDEWGGSVFQVESMASVWTLCVLNVLRFAASGGCLLLNCDLKVRLSALCHIRRCWPFDTSPSASLFLLYLQNN